MFYKATLLHQVDDLLQSVDTTLKAANALLDELEETIKPIEKEISELVGKIKNMEQVEEISQQLLHLKKKLAWSWVYDVDRNLKEQNEKIMKLRERVPTCQDKIDQKLVSKKMISLLPQIWIAMHNQKFAGVKDLSKFWILYH